MRKRFAEIPVVIITGFLFLSSICNSYGQGCSDAGFCTMGAMKPNQHLPRKMNAKLVSLETSQYLGYTKFHTTVLTYFADLNIALGSKTGVQVKLPYTLVFGELANTKGTGDISLSATRNIINHENYQLNFTLGGKLPTNNANIKTSDNRPLPMYYQTSLGTYDLILGGSLITRKWLIATGYQHPFNTIKNQFKWGAWKGTHFFEDNIVQNYPVSQYLRRGTDVMFRVERNFRSARFNTYLGLLSIYRLNKDIITSPQTGQRVKVDDSDGLVVNLLYGFGYRFSTRSAFKFVTGVGIIQRKTNPDGLSRVFVNSISYELRF
jgi:hypothetical protein